MAVMVVNATKVESSDKNKIFTDSAHISVWAKESVAKDRGRAIAGYPDGTLNRRLTLPCGSCSYISQKHEGCY